MTFNNDIDELKDEKDKRHQKLKKQMENMDCVKFSINIPRRIHIAFKRAAASEEKNMKKVIMAHILKYIEKHT